VIAAEGDGPPPPELRLAWQCQRWGGLPDAGGIYDQDALTLYRMSSLSNVYDTVKKVRSMVGKEIHKMTLRDRRLIKYLRDEGLME